MLHKTDANQKLIVQTFKQLGYTVLDLSAVGGGCPDLLVAKNSVNTLIECKTETGKLNKLQLEFIAKWNSQIFIIRNVDEVIAFDGNEHQAIRVNREAIIYNGV